MIKPLRANDIATATEFYSGGKLFQIASVERRKPDERGVNFYFAGPMGWEEHHCEIIERSWSYWLIQDRYDLDPYPGILQESFGPRRSRVSITILYQKPL